MKSVFRFLARLALVGLGLIVLIQALAWLTWTASGSGDLPLDQIEKMPAPDRHPTQAKAVHSVSEWPAERGRDFREAPALRTRVEAGELPPVTDRLPQAPLVITPPHQMGPYGGTWMSYGTGPSDVGVFRTRIAYEGLTRWDAMGRAILPNVATQWEIADAGRTFTFHLRPGIRWSDGVPLTADDIVFWYEDVLQDKDLTPVPPSELTRGGELLRLEKIDDFTIRIRFRDPHGLFLYQLTSDWGLQMLEYPAHYLKRFHPRYTDSDELTRLAKAKGFDFWYQLFKDIQGWRNVECPRLWAWVPDKVPPAIPIVFDRNPYYWKVDPDGNQLPYIDRATFEMFSRETINLKAIQGEVGMQNRHLEFSNYPLFMANAKAGGYHLVHWIDGGDGTLVIAPNLNHKDPVLRDILQDRRFRIALSHAMDRREINEVVYFSVCQPRQLAPPATSLYYVPEYENAYLDYDPDKANALLDEMGLDQRNGEGIRLRPDGRPLSIKIDMADNLAVPRPIELVADAWTRVGVETSVNLMARQLATQRRHALLQDATVWTGSGEQIPTLDPRWFFPADNSSLQALDWARWHQTGGKKGETPPADILKCYDLFEGIKNTTDETEQIRLFKDIIEINRQNLWVIGTVGSLPQVFVVNDHFRNVPEVAVTSWPLKTPGNTAPECYAFDPTFTPPAERSN